MALAATGLAGFAVSGVLFSVMLRRGASPLMLLRMMGNPTDGSELGLLGPTNLDWFVVFEFSDVGYVKDDDKDKLDPAKMLTSFQRGTEASNKEREKMGVPPMHIVGWEQEPRYNETTHNLEWAIRGESEGRPILNWNTRLLGRHGVMEVNLVVEPEHLKTTMPAYQGILQDFLEYAGALRLDRRSVDVNQLVDELVDFFLPQAEQNGVRLRADRAPGRLTAFIIAAASATVRVIGPRCATVPKGESGHAGTRPNDGL